MLVHTDTTLIWIHQERAIHAAPPAGTISFCQISLIAHMAIKKLEVSVKPMDSAWVHTQLAVEPSDFQHGWWCWECIESFEFHLRTKALKWSKILSLFSRICLAISVRTKKTTVRINLCLSSFLSESTVIMKCYITSSYKTQLVAVFKRAYLEEVTSMARQLEKIKWQH